MTNTEAENIIRQFLEKYNLFKNGQDYDFGNTESIIYDAIAKLNLLSFSDEKKNLALDYITEQNKGKQFKSFQHWKVYLKMESKAYLVKNFIKASCENNVDLENVIMSKLIENF